MLDGNGRSIFGAIEQEVRKHGEAIAATLPLGSVGYEAKLNEKGEHMIWVEAAVVDRLQGHARPDPPPSPSGSPSPSPSTASVAVAAS